MTFFFKATVTSILFLYYLIAKSQEQYIFSGHSITVLNMYWILSHTTFNIVHLAFFHFLIIPGFNFFYSLIFNFFLVKSEYYEHIKCTTVKEIYLKLPNVLVIFLITNIFNCNNCVMLIYVIFNNFSLILIFLFC